VTDNPSAPLSLEEEEIFGRLADETARGLHLNRLEQAAEGVQKLLEMSPESTTALELHGDVLRAQGDIKAARAAYQHALEAEPANADAERKYAELALQLDQATWDRDALLAGDLERFKGAPHKQAGGAAARSLLFPGLGQLYNGDFELGVALALAALLLFIPVMLLFVAPAVALALSPMSHLPAQPPGFWGWLSLVLLLGLYLYSAYEAYQSSPRSGGKV